jgi:hypothetical protein
MENDGHRFTESESAASSAEEKAPDWAMPDFARSPDVPRPLALWRSLKKRYPDILKVVSAAAAEQWEKRHGDIPVLIPFGEWVSVTKKLTGVDSDLIAAEAIRIAPVCLWALGQGIYRFDANMAEAVIGAEIPDNIPVATFSALPEYCVYAEVSHEMYKKHIPHVPDSFVARTYGFFAHIDELSMNGFPLLWITADTEDGRQSIPIELNPHLSLTDAITGLTENNKSVIPLNVGKKIILNFFRPFLSLLLYICSGEPETDSLREPGTAPRKAELTKVRKGFRFFMPQEPRIWLLNSKRF